MDGFFSQHSRTHRGRPRLSQDLLALIEQMAAENPLWGAERLRGELLKLGLPVAKDTIRTYLRRIRPPRSPSQGWNTFLKNHMKDVWACDFLPVIDLFFRTVYVFFIIDLGSRRVVHFGVTQHPTNVWVAQQLREGTPYGQAPRFLVRDNDSKLGRTFRLWRNLRTSRSYAHPIVCRAPTRSASGFGECTTRMSRSSAHHEGSAVISGDQRIRSVL
jgi:putative transposase